MKMKAFTLVELLAVIVILAIISLIAVPIVLNIISNAKLSTNMESFRSILRASNLYSVGNKKEINFVYDNGKLVNQQNTNDTLKLNGSIGESAGVKITKSNNIYSYMYKDGYCYIKRGNNSEIEQFKTDKELCNIEVATNLVKNGYGEYKDNTNFKNFEYDNGTFKIFSSKRSTMTSQEYIKIDPNKKYYMSAEIKTDNSESIYYLGIIEHDIDKKYIFIYNIAYGKNTLTYLTQDLKNGDTVVYLNDVSNFIDHSNSKGLIFWNYKDSTGYSYPEETYSNNVWPNLYTYENIDFTNNTITLNSSWNKGLIEKGVKVSQSYDGATYNYGIFAGRKFNINEWVKGEREIQGIQLGYNAPDYSKFRHGVKYIRFLTVNNYTSVSNVSTYYKNIVIKEIEE